MTSSAVRPINDPEQAKRKALRWAEARFSHCCLLDHNGYGKYPYHSVQGLLAAGSVRQLQVSADDSPFSRLKHWLDNRKWSFGFLSYDLKNDVEELQSGHPDGIGMPDLFFFEPEWVIEFFEDRVEIHAAGNSAVELGADLFGGASIPKAPASSSAPLNFGRRMPKEEYLRRLSAIQRHIQAGDVYELNFCQEFFAESVVLDAIQRFEQLNQSARAPFSAFFKLEDRYLLSTSPERFLKKEGDRLLSQPIKGTARRSPDPVRDAQLSQALRNSLKDRTENVMIVDLVRNDLGRCCLPGTVRVQELYGLYTFRHVHQLISTLSGQLRPDLHPVDAIRSMFPMGSMTGAPKVRSMQLIEQYELSRRGLYSGAVGYFRPGGDFDFNVIIRSLLYNASRRYASIQVGGAIVAASDPEAEYEECLIKVRGMLQAMQARIASGA